MEAPVRDKDCRNSTVAASPTALSPKPAGTAIAPVPRGHPAYQYMRDGDSDGIVCE